ncbi:MAG: hypothetical protein Q7U60_08265 [Candidatus Methanoperedens sp.]|nr:hypothetical protein [Candidatus Methanoperedens sp.]
MTEELEKEKNKIVSEIKNIEKKYSIGDLIDEEYEELRKPYDEKIKTIDKELQKLSGKEAEDVVLISNEYKTKSKSGFFAENYIIIGFWMGMAVGGGIFRAEYPFGTVEYFAALIGQIFAVLIIIGVHVAIKKKFFKSKL